MYATPRLDRVLRAGVASALLSTAAAMLVSRLETGRATTAINAVSHIVWGGHPPAGRGRAGNNFATGALLHFGANLFWAYAFEAVLGKQVRRSMARAWTVAFLTSVAGYVIDYGVVPYRLRPGMEAYLSRKSLIAVYAALAAGLALAARRSGPAHVLLEHRSSPQRRRSLAAHWTGSGPQLSDGS